MEMTVERVRPIKQFVVVMAYGPYRVGDKIQPTGMYRDVLVRRGLIREVKDDPAPAPQAALPETNRMVPPQAMASRAQKRR
jgi:hypothetical protein